jgi:hypothetical protein
MNDALFAVKYVGTLCAGLYVHHLGWTEALLHIL